MGGGAGDACRVFVGQGFVRGEGYRGATSVRSCWKLPLCQIEPMPAGSKTHSLLLRTEPTSDGDSPSVIVHLRRDKKKTALLQPKRGVRKGVVGGRCL